MPSAAGAGDVGAGCRRFGGAVPGRETMAKYAAAVQRLVDYALGQECVVDLGRPRHLLHEDGIEVALTIVPDNEAPPPSA